MQLADELQKFSAAQFFINERPIGNKSGDGLGPLRRRNYVVAVEQNLTGCGFQDAHHDADRRRLARAVGTKKAEDFARRHDEIEIVDSGELAIVLGEVIELNHNNFGFSILDFFDSRNGTFFNLKSAI
jgi:hypothetical protein